MTDIQTVTADFTALKITEEDGFVISRMNRPEVRNAIDDLLYQREKRATDVTTDRVAEKIAEKIAEVKSTSLDEVLLNAYQNSIRLFKF